MTLTTAAFDAMLAAEQYGLLVQHHLWLRESGWEPSVGWQRWTWQHPGDGSRSTIVIATYRSGRWEATEYDPVQYRTTRTWGDGEATRLKDMLELFALRRGA